MEVVRVLVVFQAMLWEDLCPLLLLHFSLFSPSFHFFVLRFWIAPRVFMDRSRNIGSREVDIRSPFWRHYGILRFRFSVNRAIDEVTV